MGEVLESGWEIEQIVCLSLNEEIDEQIAGVGEQEEEGHPVAYLKVTF